MPVEGTPEEKINALISHPEFAGLPDEEKRSLILKVKGSPALAPASQSFGDKLRTQGPIPTQPTGDPSMGRGTTTFNRDAMVDQARPFVAGAVGDIAGGATLASGLGTGGVSSLATPAAYTGAYSITDALMQYLKEKKPESFTGALGEGAVQGISGKVISGLLNAAGRGVKAFHGASTPDPASSIFNFSPTTSQALRSEGSPFLARTAKLLEDSSLTAKEKALDASAGKGFSQALKLANSNEFARLDNGQMSFSNDPNKMLSLVNKQMPFSEGAFTPVKGYTDMGREVTPVTFKDTGRGVTPLTRLEGNTKVSPPVKPGFLPGEPTTVPGGRIEVQPGEVTTKPGGSIFAQYGENPTAGFQTLPELDKVIADPVKLDKALAMGQAGGTDNVRKTLAGYQFGRIFNNATITDASGRVTRIDPEKLKAFGDLEMQASNKKLFSAATRSNIDQLFKNITATQDKIDVSSSAKRFWLTRGGIALGAGMLTGSMGGPAIAGATTIGVFVAANQLGKLMANPTTARVVIAMAGKEALGMSEGAAGRLITRALQGERLASVNADGSMTPFVLDKNSQAQPVGQ